MATALYYYYIKIHHLGTLIKSPSIRNVTVDLVVNNYKLSLDCNPDGVLGEWYTWKSNNEFILNSDHYFTSVCDSKLVIKDLRVSHAGSYHCAAYTKGGIGASKIFSVTIRSKCLTIVN